MRRRRSRAAGPSRPSRTRSGGSETTYRNKHQLDAEAEHQPLTQRRSGATTHQLNAAAEHYTFLGSTPRWSRTLTTSRAAAGRHTRKDDMYVSDVALTRKNRLVDDCRMTDFVLASSLGLLPSHTRRVRR